MNGEGWLVDLYGGGDKTFLLKSIEAVMLATYPEIEGIGRLDMRGRAEALLARYFERNGRISLVRIEGESVGVLWWVEEFHPFTEERTALILIVSVETAFRRRGIAKKLLEDARAEALVLGIKKLRLFVNPENQPAWQLYGSLGFFPKISELAWEIG